MTPPPFQPPRRPNRPGHPDRPGPGASSAPKGPGGAPAPAPSPAGNRPGGAAPGTRRRPALQREIWPPSDLVALGRLLRPHGLRGEIRAFPFSHAQELLESMPEEVLIWFPDNRRETHKIDSISEHQGILLLGFEGIDDRDAAEAFRGAFIAIPEAQRWELGADEFYVDDLVGMMVTDTTSGRQLGTVRRVVDGSHSDYLEIPIPGEPLPILIPLLKALGIKVDKAARTITAALPDGFLDLSNAQGAIAEDSGPAADLAEPSDEDEPDADADGDSADEDSDSAESK